MKKVSFSKKTMATVSIFTLLALGFFIFYVYPNFIFSKPLGDKLEYIGKTDYGCWLACDANPGSTYYYATDMSVEKVADSLFTKATLKEKPQLGSTPMGNKEIQDFWIQLQGSHGQNLYITYYQDASELRHFLHLKDTSKPHVISIGSESYAIAKDML